MWCLVFILGVMVSLVVPEPKPGLCLSEINETKTIYVNGANKTVTETRSVPGCCPNYRPTKNSTPEHISCDPICEPECHKNATCTGINICACNRGFVKDRDNPSVCKSLCDSCVHSSCKGGDYCQCDPGYVRSNLRHVCDPKCTLSCVNSNCVAPNECRCLEGYSKLRNSTNVCKPECRDQCVFGTCTGVNECTCQEGYKKKANQKNVCEPVCSGCENGTCKSPDYCECNPGFMKSQMSPHHCVHESESFTFCNFTIPKATQHVSSSDCFSLKTTLLTHHSDCDMLNTLDPQCFEEDPSSTQDCTLEFECVKSSSNATNRTEIHCNLTNSDFIARENVNMNLQAWRWEDVTVVLYAAREEGFYPTRGLDVGHRQWTLRSSSKWPSCEQQVFGIEICGAPSKKIGDDESQGMWVGILVFLLIIALLAMAGVARAACRKHNHRHGMGSVTYRPEDRPNSVLENPSLSHGPLPTVPAPNDGKCLSNPMYGRSRGQLPPLDNGRSLAARNGDPTGSNGVFLQKKQIAQATYSDDTSSNIYEEIGSGEGAYDGLLHCRPSPKKPNYEPIPFKSKHPKS